jgi:hypothetical protein
MRTVALDETEELLRALEAFIDAKIAFVRMSVDQRKLYCEPLNERRAKLSAALSKAHHTGG